MPERYVEAMALIDLQPQNAIQAERDGISQTFRWTNDLPIDELSTAVLECVEQKAREQPVRFLWATNFHVTANNAAEIANHGGRLRWNVENEGFNTQKNQGYGMAHSFSEHPNAAQNFYVLLLIAHYICQLILHGSLIQSLARTFESAKNFCRRLAESMRNQPACVDIPIPGQIRFRPP